MLNTRCSTFQKMEALPVGRAWLGREEGDCLPLAGLRGRDMRRLRYLRFTVATLDRASCPACGPPPVWLGFIPVPAAFNIIAGLNNLSINENKG